MEDFEFEDEVKHNPWRVKSIEDFRFYCCPECEKKEVKKSDFLRHALNNHPKSQELFDTLEVGGSFHTKMETKDEMNPWSVRSIEDFRCYSCPECESKTETKMKFLRHIMIGHPNSQELFESLEVSASTSAPTDKPKVNPEPSVDENADEQEKTVSSTSSHGLFKCVYCQSNETRYTPEELRRHHIANHTTNCTSGFPETTTSTTTPAAAEGPEVEILEELKKHQIANHTAASVAQTQPTQPQLVPRPVEFPQQQPQPVQAVHALSPTPSSSGPTLKPIKDESVFDFAK